MGLRLAKNKNNKPSEEIKEDPRKIREVAEWNRLRLIIWSEAGHQAWGCPLYALARAGKISEDHREAGDLYYRAIRDYKSTQAIDLDDIPARSQDFQKRRIAKAKGRYLDLVSLLGLGRRLVDDLVFEEIYPATERQMVLTRACLEQLRIYFKEGEKKR